MAQYDNLGLIESTQKTYAMVQNLDENFGRLRQALEELGIAEDTLVLFTSDNGPATNGGAHPRNFDSAGPWRGSKGSLYEGGIRVPLIASWPGHIAPGTTTDHRSAFHDIAPTILEAAGVEALAGIDGISFSDALRGRAQDSSTLYWELGSSQAIRDGEWKLVRHWNKSEGRVRSVELYDLASDPGEERDLAKTKPALVDELSAQLAAWRASVGALPMIPRDQEPNPARLNQAKFWLGATFVTTTARTPPSSSSTRHWPTSCGLTAPRSATRCGSAGLSRSDRGLPWSVLSST